MGLNLGRTLRNMFTPPSSWDSFKKGTLAPTAKVGGALLGNALIPGAGGYLGAALGGALGGIAGDAVAGENVRRATTLRSVLGDAAQGAATKGVGDAVGGLKGLFSGGGAAASGAGGFDPMSGGRDELFRAGVSAPPAVPSAPGLLDKAGDLGSWATKNAGPIAQTLVGGLQANALNQQNQMEQQKLDLVRQQYEDEQKRRKANAALYAPVLQELLRSLQLGGK